MIKVSIKGNNDVVVISGHAGYNKYGTDIVCAAVSSTVLTTINAIFLINESSIKVTEGNELIIKVINHNDIIDKLIINMINSLDELEKDYSKNININREV